MKFSIGRVCATPAALAAIQDSGQKPEDFLDRHVRGDWGNVSDDDRQCNEVALRDGSRIWSIYQTRAGIKFWIITEAVDDAGQRTATTILLPEEY